jgi:hypothetical protein
MANWLDRMLPPAPKGKVNLPALSKMARQMMPATQNVPHSGKLPNASLVYGIAAGGLMAVGLYFLFTGSWFTGILVLLPAACFLGYALYFIKYQQ